MTQILVQFFTHHQNEAVLSLLQTPFLSEIPGDQKLTVYRGGSHKKWTIAQILTKKEKFDRIEAMGGFETEVAGLQFIDLFLRFRLSPTNLMWDDPAAWPDKNAFPFKREKTRALSKSGFKDGLHEAAYPSTLNFRWETEAEPEIVFERLRQWLPSQLEKLETTCDVMLVDLFSKAGDGLCFKTMYANFAEGNMAPFENHAEKMNSMGREVDDTHHFTFLSQNQEAYPQITQGMERIMGNNGGALYMDRQAKTRTEPEKAGLIAVSPYRK